MTTEKIKAIAARAAESILQKTKKPEPVTVATTEARDNENTSDGKQQNPFGHIDGFQCKIKVEPLKEWFATEIDEDGECHPCRMLPLASLYLGTLQKAGKTEDAAELEKVYEGGDILTIAECMDKIKSRAEEQLRQALEELDCFAESYKELAVEVEQEE